MWHWARRTRKLFKWQQLTMHYPDSQASARGETVATVQRCFNFILLFTDVLLNFLSPLPPNVLLLKHYPALTHVSSHQKVFFPQKAPFCTENLLDSGIKPVNVPQCYYSKWWRCVLVGLPDYQAVSPPASGEVPLLYERLNFDTWLKPVNTVILFLLLWQFKELNNQEMWFSNLYTGFSL